MLDAQIRLEYAVAASRFGRGPATVAAKVRKEGLSAFESIVDELTDDQATEVMELASQLHADGVSALLAGEPGYPVVLANARVSAAVLFIKGSRQLLDRPGLGICGARNATAEGLKAARSCSEVIASLGFNVVSGYARGVDMACHSGALAAGGTTVVVLPEGIQNFKIRSGEFGQLWDPARVVVVSQFSPRQPWSAAGAMARNSVISGLSQALVVVEAGETGGTLAAGMHALDRGQPVMALELFGAPPGNRLLQDRGATPIRSRDELESCIAEPPPSGSAQLTLL